MLGQVVNSQVGLLRVDNLPDHLLRRSDVLLHAPNVGLTSAAWLELSMHRRLHAQRAAPTLRPRSSMSVLALCSQAHMYKAVVRATLRKQRSAALDHDQLPPLLHDSDVPGTAEPDILH